jgi:hypothetical protein
MINNREISYRIICIIDNNLMLKLIKIKIKLKFIKLICGIRNSKINRTIRRGEYFSRSELENSMSNKIISVKVIGREDVLKIILIKGKSDEDLILIYKYDLGDKSTIIKMFMN